MAAVAYDVKLFPYMPLEGIGLLLYNYALTWTLNAKAAESITLD